MEYAELPCPSTANAPSIGGPINYKPATVNSLDDLIAQLYEAFGGDHVDVDHVTEIMEAYKSVPAEWRKFAKFDRYKYTRNLVDEGNGKFNIMLLCWGPSHISSIHDHTDAHCFMKVLSGSLAETRYEWPNGEMPEDQEEAAADPDGDHPSGMRVIGKGSLDTNEVCYINDSLGLHRVSNSSDTEGAVSLHLYCPPFSSCQTFDEATGRRRRCPVTFYSKFGKKVKYCQN